MKKVNPRQLDMYGDNSAIIQAGSVKWSPFNEDIFKFFEEQHKNIAIRARAGSGKSTTLRELVKRTKTNSLVLAFNASAKKEFEERIKADGRQKFKTKVLTMSGLGYRAIIARLGLPEEVSRYSDRMKKIIKSKHPSLSYDKINALAKMTRYARNYVRFTDKMWLNAMSRSGIYDLWSEDDASEAVEIAMECIEASVDLEQTPKLIDLEDMSYVPFRQKWSLDGAATVFVDETQDLAEVDIALLWKAKGKDARVIVVGDDLQCHPGNAMVLASDSTYRRIDSLDATSMMSSWDSVGMQPQDAERRVKISSRHYEGTMLRLRILGGDTEVTPNHKFLTQWSDYASRCFGLFLVLREDGEFYFKLEDIISFNSKDAAWLLAWGEDIETIETIKAVYERDIPKNDEAMSALLVAHGLRLELPLWPHPAIQAKYKYPAFPAYAANLRYGIYELWDSYGTPQPIQTTESRPFSGVVYSLDVDQDHAYVAGGIATLNSIYAFRGADSFAMPRVIKALDAHVMPLPVTYRCAQAIVRVAARFAPDIRAREGAPDGVLKNVTPEEMRSMWRPGDLVISRTNAPLIGHAIAAMKQGIPAYVEGRAEDMGIDTLLRRFDRSGTSFRDVLKNARAWADEEKAKFIAVEDQESAAGVEDRIQTLLALSEGCSSSADVMKRLSRLMNEASSNGSIRMSTVHKAKGSEAERVFMLTETFRLGGKDAAEAQEEKNLYYVAVTRAKNELYFVRSVAV